MPRLKMSACGPGRISMSLRYGDLVSLRLLETAESTKAADTATTGTFLCLIGIFRVLVSTDSISICLRCPGEDGVFHIPTHTPVSSIRGIAGKIAQTPPITQQVQRTLYQLQEAEDQGMMILLAVPTWLELKLRSCQ